MQFSKFEYFVNAAVIAIKKNVGGGAKYKIIIFVHFRSSVLGRASPLSLRAIAME